ncbi:MAG: hypothetical protein IJ702_01120 [Fretibacterium sp.]|nr:hypothetical protein [Fretibacterium sp.]
MRGKSAWPVRCLLLALLLCVPCLPAPGAEVIEYDLAHMRQMNPDFTTYPEEKGIVWLKQVSFARAEGGGVERTHLWVILGRQGLSGRWLTWNIPDPEGGSAEVVEASVYSPETGGRLAAVPVTSDGGLHTVKFERLPETFILVLSWRDVFPEQLTLEGLCWFSAGERESLRVWESVVEVRTSSPRDLAYRAFPMDMRPEFLEEDEETACVWRKINVEPLPWGLSLEPGAGVAFSVRRGEAGVARLIRGVENIKVPDAPGAALAGFRKSPAEGMTGLLSWLYQQPKIVLAEGTERKIPASAPWTRGEKVLLARAWLREKGTGASLWWRVPLDVDERTPVCTGLLQGPLLELPLLKGSGKSSGSFFYDMDTAPVVGSTAPLLKGARLLGLDREGALTRKRIPAAKAGENRLSAVMDLNLNGQGALSGPVRVMLRGAWGPFLLSGSAPAEAELDAAVPALFPGLQNYSKVKFRSVKGVPELSFVLEGKPGVAGSGQGILALPPSFDPVAFRALDGLTPPFELRFPFVLEQSVNISLPKGVERALVSGGVNRSPDKINYSENYKVKRRKLTAEARFEAGVTNVTGSDAALLQRNMQLWRSFSSKPLPIQGKAPR